MSRRSKFADPPKEAGSSPPAVRIGSYSDGIVQDVKRAQVDPSKYVAPELSSKLFPPVADEGGAAQPPSDASKKLSAECDAIRDVYVLADLVKALRLFRDRALYKHTAPTFRAWAVENLGERIGCLIDDNL